MSIALATYRAAWTAALALASPAVAYGLAFDRWDLRGRLFPPRADVSDNTWWWHGASAGEVRALATFRAAIRWHGLPWRAASSASTAAGCAIWRRTMLPGDGAPHPLPPDLPYVWRRLVPENLRLVVLSETELWPGWLDFLTRRDCPVAVASGRMSPWTARALSRLRLVDPARLFVAAQTDEDAEGFRALGVPADRIAVTGSLKWPRGGLSAGKSPEERAALREKLGAGEDPVVVAGSIRREEIATIVRAFVMLRRCVPEARLVLAPRFSTDVPRAERLLCDAGFAPVRWSERRSSATAGGTDTPVRLPRSCTAGNDGQECPSHLPRPYRLSAAECATKTHASRDSAVVLVDTMGDLPDLYSIARAAIVGGSWVAIGGHNPFEAAASGAPVLYGPHMAQPGCRLIEATRQARRVADANALGAELADALAERRTYNPPRYPDPVRATWDAWRRWGIAPPHADVE